MPDDSLYTPAELAALLVGSFYTKAEVDALLAGVPTTDLEEVKARISALEARPPAKDGEPGVPPADWLTTLARIATMELRVTALEKGVVTPPVDPPVDPPKPPGTGSKLTFATNYADGLSELWVDNKFGSKSGSDASMSAGYPLSIINTDRGKALRFEVHPGDRAPFDPDRNNRSEVNATEKAGYGKGTDYWARFSTRIDAIDTANTGSWSTLTTQWHPPNGSPVLGFFVNGNNWCLIHQPQPKPGGDYSLPVKTLWSTPVAKGQWHDIVIQITGDAVNGAVQLWHNGTKVLTWKGSTLIPGDGTQTYLKYGIYREALPTGAAPVVVTHGAYSTATSEADLNA